MSKENSANPWFYFITQPTAELTVIQDNAFLDSGTLTFEAGHVAGIAATSDTAFIGPNYYGTTDAVIIDQMVYDSSDDLSRSYRIIVAPILETSPVAACSTLATAPTPTAAWRSHIPTNTPNVPTPTAASTSQQPYKPQ